MGFKTQSVIWLCVNSVHLMFIQEEWLRPMLHMRIRFMQLFLQLQTHLQERELDINKTCLHRFVTKYFKYKIARERDAILKILLIIRKRRNLNKKHYRQGHTIYPMEIVYDYYPGTQPTSSNVAIHSKIIHLWLPERPKSSVTMTWLQGRALG